MKLWKRVSGLLKDQNSLLLVGLSSRSAIRNPDIGAAVIKATSHDEFAFGYENPDRVYEWLRLSDSHIHPVVWGIAARVEKTRSWVVALKALMLMHGVFCTKLSVIQTIGKLPFNLSNFKDRHSEHGKSWSYNVFIRAYFEYLDQKSVLLFEIYQERKGSRRDYSLMQDLTLLQKFQGLLDRLLQIKPPGETAPVFLIVEAMECVVFEVFDIYSRLCRMIADTLRRIDSASKDEAALILQILKKAINQGEEFALYMEFCKEIGVTNASSYPIIPQVPKEDVQLLEHVVHGAPQQPERDEFLQESKGIASRDCRKCDHGDDSKNKCRTIVTTNWEKFDEDLPINGVESNPFSDILFHPLPKSHQMNQELPDLIRF